LGRRKSKEGAKRKFPWTGNEPSAGMEVTKPGECAAALSNSRKPGWRDKRGGEEQSTLFKSNWGRGGDAGN